MNAKKLNYVVEQRMQVRAEGSDNLINSFLNNQRSDNTKRLYKRALESFFSFVKGPYEAQTHYDFSNYRDYLEARDCSSATIHAYFSAIRSFYKWGYKTGNFSKNIDPNILLKKLVVENTEALSDEDIERMIIYTRDHGSFDEYMTMCVLAFLGLRRSEAVIIDFTQINRYDNGAEIRILGKGNKIRYIELPDYLDKILNNAQKAGRTGKIIPYSDSWVYKLVKRVCDELGIEGKSPHSFRVSAISQMFDESVSPKDIADFAGHSNIQTTMGYYRRRKHRSNPASKVLKYGKVG